MLAAIREDPESDFTYLVKGVKVDVFDAEGEEFGEAEAAAVG
jgi:hypothetical protein